MKVAVWHNLHSGGGKRALHDHVRGLVMRGHYVESWSPPAADLSYMPLSRYAAEHVVPFDWKWQPAGSRSPIGGKLKPCRDIVARIEAMMRHARQCAEEISRKGFDLILGNSCIDFATPFIARFADVPTVLYLQEPFRPFYEATPHGDIARLEWVAPLPQPSESRSLLRRMRQAGPFIYNLAEAHAIRIQAREEAVNAHAFDQVLCNSRFSREAILRAYGRDSRVCYLGIDTDAFRPTGAPKERYVVGLGSFAAHKGLDVAVRAVATIDPAHRPSLVWIGNSGASDYLRDVTELAATLGVDFVPKKLVGQDELVDLLSRAAVMAYTSRLEPFGYAPLEANACGTAVVAVAEGGIRESIDHGVNGLLVEGGDPVALGQAIARYVDDLGLARDDGLRAREHVVSRWRVEAAVDRLENHLIDSLKAK
jgi:glycosyltransferase involved in cell wall biosynthesis